MGVRHARAGCLLMQAKVSTLVADDSGEVKRENRMMTRSEPESQRQVMYPRAMGSWILKDPWGLYDTQE